MFAGSIVLSLTLICFAFWLQWNERNGWPGDDEADDSEEDRVYFRRRYRSRRRIHWIIGGCGVLISMAGWAGPANRKLWVGAWSIVMLGLMVVVLLALLDALRTHRHHARKLPKIRRQFLGDED